MKKKITTILVAALLSVGTAVGLSACANQEDIDNALLPVEQQVTLINTTLDEMKATDKTLGDSITALTGRVTTLEGELEIAQNNIGSVSSALTQEIADRKADIKTLQDKDADLQAQITALETALTNKEQGIKDWANGAFVTVAAWNEFKTQINTTIASLTSRIETLESSVGKINSTLTEMKATDTSLKNSIDGLTTRVTKLETELVEVNAKITSLQTDSATKAELETVKTALQKQIDDLNDEIDELKNKDTDLKMQIDNLQDLLTVEIGNVKDWANNIFLSIENWNTAKIEIDDKISALRDRVVVIENTLETMNTVISALQQQVEQNKQDIADLTIRVNCLEGKHVAEVIDETTYSWSDDFTTCTVKGICKYCEARHDITENTTHEGYIYKVSFINGKYTHQIDLVNLTDMDSTLQEKALSFLLAAQPSTLTLTLPKDFSSFSFINDPIKSYDEGKYIDLTLKGVKLVTKQAFSMNSNLKAIHLPDVTTIGNDAFEACDKLADISVEKVEKLGDGAFWGCTSLTEIELPSVTSIGSVAFCNTHIERIKFGSAITEVGKLIFSDVDTTKCVLIFAEGQKKFTGSDPSGWVESSEAMTSSDTEFVGNTFKKLIVGDIAECTTHDTEVVYKWSVDYTSCTAVSECKNCFRTFANETVTGDKISLNGFIYTATFENALFGTKILDLTDLTNFNEYQYSDILKSVLSKKVSDVTLTLPTDFDDFDSLKSIITQNYENGTLNLTLKGIKKIPSEAFKILRKLKSINLVNVIEIGDNAFTGCSELTEVTANNVTKIGTKAFYQCNRLTNVNVSKVTEIGDQAFGWCTKLKELTFEATTIAIGANVFELCSKLEKITFGGIITKIGADVFKDTETDNCTLVLAKGQKNFTAAADGSFTISDTDVVSGTNKTFCGYTFKEIIIAEE